MQIFQDSTWEVVDSAVTYLTPVLLGVLGLLTYEIYSENSSAKKNKSQQKKREQKKFQFKLMLAVTFVVSIFGLVAHIIAFNKQEDSKSFNTDIGKQYLDKYDTDFMLKQRSKAAQALTEYLSSTNQNWATMTNGTGALDEVLGFFDELGYDEIHKKISQDVAYEYFYSDVAGYYQAAEQYIAYSQKTDSPTDFENIKPLFNALNEVEFKKINKPLAESVWTKKDLVEFLKKEIDLKDEK